MAVNFDFTPSFKAVLASMGIDFSKMRASMDAAASSKGGLNVAPISFNPSIASNDQYFKLKRSGIDTGGELLNTDSVQRQVATLKKRSSIDASTQKLYDSILKMREQEKNRGAPDTSPHKSWWAKTLDIISRPMQAVETGYYNKKLADKADTDKGFKDFIGIDHLGEFGKGLKQGIQGKSKTGSDIASDVYGIKNKPLKFATGLGLDVALDPLSYVGFGIGKSVAGAGVKTATTEQAAKNITEALAKGPAVKGGIKIPTSEELTHSLGGRINTVLTPTEKAKAAQIGAIHIDKISAMLGKQAGKAAQLSVTDDLTKLGLSKADSLAAAKKWLDPKYAKDPNVLSQKNTYAQLIKTLPGMKSSKYLNSTLPTLVKETQSTAAKQLTEVLNANLEQEIKRTLRFRGPGLDIPIAPIPAATMKAVDKIAKAPVINTVVKGFDKAFNTGSGFDHDLYVTKSRAAGKAEQRINIGQKKLVDAFQGMNKDQRVGYMRALAGNPGSFGRGVITTRDGRDMADVAQEFFDYVGKYIDWSGKGLGVISLHKLNSYLPEKYKFDTALLKKNPQLFNPSSNKGAQNFLNMIAQDRVRYSKVDPQDMMYHMLIGTEKVLARDQFLRGISELGVPIKAHNLTQAKIGKEGNTVAHQLVTKHGYEDIPAKGTEAVVDSSFHRYLNGKVFHPEIKQGVVKMLDMIDDPSKTSDFMRAYDRALGYFKKSVTLPMPSYHIRNSVGDVFTSYLDGVTGARGMASYAQAAKVMKSMNPLSKEQEVSKILEAPVNASGNIDDPMQQIAQLLKAGRVSKDVMKKNPKWKDVPGKYVSAEQFLAAYQHMGLKRGFVASDIERELRGNPNLFMKALHLPMDQVTNLSQSREDFFRMAHFIDRIKRSNAPTFEQAAKEAAHYVKKFHFDYTDVTPTERAVFARLIPFYKFQRFATPLMLQMFAATPGRILNAQKVLNNMSYASGYTNDGGFLPTADQILPEYMKDAFMLPLFELGGSTVYGGAGLLPSTSILDQTLGGSGTNPQTVLGGIGRNIIQSATPALQIPIEEYYGKKILGKGQIPIGSQKDYLLSRNPALNLGNQLTGDTGPEGLVRLLNAISGLGLSQNTPARQKSELYRERDQIIANRKKDHFTTRKPTAPGNLKPYTRPPGG
jgi:hypothetical protein